MLTLLAILLACGDKDTSGDSGSAANDSGSGTTEDGGSTSDGGSADGGSTSDGGETDGGGEEKPPPPPELSLSLTGPAVLDPLRGGTLELGWATTNTDVWTVDLALTVQDATGATVAELGAGLDPESTLSWDLRDLDGVALPVGTYTVVASLVDPDDSLLDQETSTLWVVRTGLLEGTYGGPKLPDDNRIALLWHQAEGASPYWHDGAVSKGFSVEAITAGEGAKEVAVEIPAVYEDLAVPPSDPTALNMPVGYGYDSQPYLTVVLGNDLGEAATAGAWSAAIDGWELVEGTVADGTLVFHKTEALAEGPAVLEGSWTFSLSVDEALVMSQEIPYRVYASMGQPTFTSSEAPHMLWVTAADEALRVLDGLEPEDSVLLDALVEWVYTELGLRYDTRSGASFYASYSGWGSGRLAFRSFLSRSNGSIVNCSDCAGIVGSYANMLGIPLDYSIILSNYNLNYTKPIGGDEFSSCPFGDGVCGFSYHAVTTNDASATIWDATLALDGDEDPGTSPSEELLVQTIDGEEYLERLVRSGSAGYYYDTSRIRIY